MHGQWGPGGNGDEGLRMKVEYINPFIESTYDLFKSMLSSKAVRGEVGLASPDATNSRDLIALIGLSGEARGMVAVSFPVETALNIVNRLLSTDIRGVDETVLDGLAEVANMIAGGAKSRLSQSGRPPIDLSLPSVVRGSNFEVNYPSGAVWLQVPFTSDLGDFSVRVTFELKAG